MKIEMKSYPMVVDQFLKMLRSDKVTPEVVGETIAVFLYDEELSNAIEILNQALFSVLKNYRNKKAWDDREGKKFREDLAYAKKKMDELDKDPHCKLKIKDGMVTGIDDREFVPDDIEF